MNTIPDNFARTIAEVHGEAGVEWLGRLSDTVAVYSRRWSLTVRPPPWTLSYNYVAPAVRIDGREVVLKLGVPHRELFAEIEALRLFAGRGTVQLLDSDPDEGALLLERLDPGTPLTSVADDGQATSIAAEVMRRMWTPAPQDHVFPTVASWATGMHRLRTRFDGDTGPFPAALVEAAESLFDELIGSMDEPMLLHGDLHHGNIRAAERQPWLAIDPKGLVGEPAYEVGALLRNPMPGLLDAPHPGRVLARRVDLLAEELGFDRERLAGWGLAQAVLSAWWSFEDHGRGWEPAIACAELLASLLPKY